MSVNKIMFGFGLFLALLTALFLMLGVIGFGSAAAIGILGVGFIAVSRRKISTNAIHQPPREQIEQTVHSPDNKQRALIKRRTDGNYQIEIQRFIEEYSQDFGPNNRWERTSSSISGSIEDALKTAAYRVGAGTNDFFDSEE
ncbi:MAG TPA: hypothetical protein VJ972_08195 [Anaerolineales bacterium]|nr:hypothetical protein [Anaerolineales bacterium]